MSNVKKCFVRNISRGTQIVYSARRAPIYVPPGQTVPIDLDENTAERIRDWATKTLEIVSENVARTPEESFHKEGDESEPAATDVDVTAASLLVAYENKELTYVQLVKQARNVLGEKMPDGVPKKTELVALLKAEG